MPKAKAKSGAPPNDPVNFEETLAEVERLVAQLEGGPLALDEALALFERGQTLTARCQTLLDQAELRLQQLSPRNDGYALEAFNEAEEAAT